MALRQVRIAPDDILNKKSRPVAVIDDKIKELVADMLETMYATEGVGLAAVQIGVLKRIFVIDMSDDGTDPIVVINPEILHSEGTQEEMEACLSVPNLSGKVTRPAIVVIKALDEDGIEYEMECDGFLAVAMCHELDHLDGILYDSRASQMYEESEDDRQKRKAQRRAKNKGTKASRRKRR